MRLLSRRAAAPLIVSFMVGLLLPAGAAPAWPHTGGYGNVRVVLDKVPAELRDLGVQLVVVVAPQLLVTNPTDEPVRGARTQRRPVPAH